MDKKIIVVTANYVPGYKIIKVIGLNFRIIVRSRGLGGNIVAKLQATFVGGEIGVYTKMLAQTREQAVERLEAQAKELGANAVINAGFDSTDIGGLMNEIVAYGTAVVIEKETKTAGPVSLR